MKYAVEVRLVDRPDAWQRMRHIFDERQSAENIRQSAAGASDVLEARVVEATDAREGEHK